MRFTEHETSVTCTNIFFSHNPFVRALSNHYENSADIFNGNFFETVCKYFLKNESFTRARPSFRLIETHLLFSIHEGNFRGRLCCHSYRIFSPFRRENDVKYTCTYILLRSFRYSIQYCTDVIKILTYL